MKVTEVNDTRSSFIPISLEFPNLNRLLKVKLNGRITTLKSLRPILAEKFGSDFAHFRLKFTAKNDKKQILDIETPLLQLSYFHKHSQLYKIEVEMEYEGG